MLLKGMVPVKGVTSLLGRLALLGKLPPRVALMGEVTSPELLMMSHHRYVFHMCQGTENSIFLNTAPEISSFTLCTETQR